MDYGITFLGNDYVGLSPIMPFQIQVLIELRVIGIFEGLVEQRRAAERRTLDSLVRMN